MSRLYTRVKAVVDADSEAELPCTICEEWKPVTEFKSKADNRRGRSLRYETRCDPCNNVYKSKRRRIHGVETWPSVGELRTILGKQDTNSFTGLNQAHHATRTSTPLPEPEKAALRERREAAEGQPDLCYLTGMVGDNSAVKIGHSTNPWARLGEYQAGNPKKLEVLAVLDGGEAKEKELHRKFFVYHGKNVGEWFNKSPEIMNHFAAGRVS